MAMLDVLEKKIIPWIEAGKLGRLVVAGLAHEKLALPEDMERTPVRMKGRRIGIQGTGSQTDKQNYLAC